MCRDCERLRKRNKLLEGRARRYRTAWLLWKTRAIRLAKEAANAR